MDRKRLNINIKCFKWLHKVKNKKYDEMFDYDTSEFLYSNYTIYDKGTILDNFTKLSFLENSDDDSLHLNESEYQNNKIVVYKRSSFDYSDFVIQYNKDAYIVAKYYDKNNDGLTLNIGNIIKLGKHLLKVLALRLKTNLKFIRKYYSNVLEKSSIREEQCKICFNEHYLNDDLLSVCDCKGTLKYIHQTCLQMWLKSKAEIRYKYISPNYFIIMLEGFYCEICKKTFPLIVRKENGDHIYLLDVLRNKDNFIVLKNKIIEDEHSTKTVRDDYVLPDKDKLQIIELHFLEFTKYKNSIYIGRDEGNDIRLKDISVSRRHCKITMDEGQLRVTDEKSKFGTLISMSDDIILNENNKKATLQKGNTVYHFKYKNCKN
jgi:hypothetical protein